MIDFSYLPLPEELIRELEKLHIDFAFQPIFLPDGKTIYAREALMRPKDCNVMELIDKYTAENKLHIIEVATFFGAAQTFLTRGYTERIAVNTFPCEYLSDTELKTFIDYFGEICSAIIFETLEYPRFSFDCYLKKKELTQTYKSIISLDDYGTGLNDFSRVKIIDPQIVKLDRSLISNIDKDKYKQANCRDIIEQLHQMGKVVVAEGVETEEEFNYLIQLGADLFQGYYLARPA